MFSYFSNYSSSIRYLVLSNDHLARLCKEGNFIAFNYESFDFLSLEHVLYPANIEQVTLMLESIESKVELRFLFGLRFLLSDAYLIQARNGTARKKGVALAGLRSRFRILSRKYEWTMLLVSETLCSITQRQINER